MKFLHPEYLKLFFLPLAVLPCWLFFLYSKHQSRQILGVGRALTRISHFSSVRKDFMRCLLLNGVMAAIILALAHPQLMHERKVPQQAVMDVVFLLDTSPSMKAADIQPSRLERALEVIGAFCRTKPEHDRIGLVSFAGNSMIISHLTEDANNILYYLEYLKETPLSPGTNIGRGLRNGLTVVRKETEMSPGAARNKKVFILLSDGEDNSSELDAALNEVSEAGIKVHTIGIGSLEGAPIPIGFEQGRQVYLEDDKGRRIITRFDDKTLQWIAQKTGGKFQRSWTGFEIEKAFSEIVLKEREVTGFSKIVEYQDFYHEFLVAAVGIFLTTILM
ncbi:MAG TPA: VWA domain-containing protein [Candidatus Udaeobacter sp.]|jgi:Ca-activated chloride channel family protein|nr:VWA domain-containing protein [Candidatus Udaeobacter sp.]